MIQNTEPSCKSKTVPPNSGRLANMHSDGDKAYRVQHVFVVVWEDAN